uniref:Uncharacterized protein n=1 Tax=Vitis vinifera TaxID=29760 RepID=F6I1D4_VITVI
MAHYSLTVKGIGV